jgi:hypothetical protein
MTPTLAFLHTSPVHVPTFTGLLARLAPGTLATHVVDQALLRDAQADGPAHPAIVARVQAAVRALAAQGAQVVVCTCSTIGAAAEATPTAGRFTSTRIDRAMADQAVALGPRVLVVAALASTLAPTAALVADSAQRLGLPVQLRTHLAEGAWAHFEAGQQPAYLQAVAAAVRAAIGDASVVVLAQASMAGAADALQGLGLPVLCSPELGVCAALGLARPG